MIKNVCLIIVIIILQIGCSESKFESTFNGKAAYDYVEKIVGFGQRTSGSEQLIATSEFILNELKTNGINRVEFLDFIANTPHGATPMRNVVAYIPGAKDQFVIVSGHYDLKKYPASMQFVGANDSGSSTALLLELSKVLKTPHYSIMLIFFDGEECFENYSTTDGLYGSKYMVEYLRQNNQLNSCIGMINVDMIGDKDLQFTLPANSDLQMYKILKTGEEILGYNNIVKLSNSNILDDLEPFRQAGVRAINIIDFNYGPNNSFWHTSEDNLTNISAESLEKTGKLVHYLIENLTEK